MDAHKGDIFYNFSINLYSGQKSAWCWQLVMRDDMMQSKREVESDFLTILLKYPHCIPLYQIIFNSI